MEGNIDELISRKAVLKLFATHDGKYLYEAIRNMPAAQPKRIRGRWIDDGFYGDGHSAHAFRCSVCGQYIIDYDVDPFCRWCGAKMNGDEEDE